MDVATVIITGLSLLVQPSSGGLNAFLVSAAPELSTTNSQRMIPKHVAFVMYDVTQVDRSPSRTTRQPDVQFISNGTTYGLNLLDGEVFTIDGVDKADSLRFDGENANLGQGSDRERFSEVQTFNDVCPKCGAPDPKIVDTNIGSKLGAAFYFAQGHVAATGVSDKQWGFCRSDKDGDCLPGKDPEKDKPVVMPQRVAVDMRLAGKYLILVSHPKAKAPGVTVDKLAKDYTNSFWFKSGASVMIGSAPLEDLLGLSHEDMDAMDRHFEHYYDLLSDKTQPRYIPRQKADKSARSAMPEVPAMTAIGPRVFFLHGSNCPPMAYVQP